MYMCVAETEFFCRIERERERLCECVREAIDTYRSVRIDWSVCDFWELVEGGGGGGGKGCDL